MLRRLLRSVRRAVRLRLRSVRRVVNRPLRFFTNAVTVASRPGAAFTQCGGADWRVTFRLARPSAKGGYIVQQVDEHRDGSACGGGSDAAAPTSYWVAWEVPPSRQEPAARLGGEADFDDACVEANHAHREGTLDVLGTVRFYEDVALPPDMVAFNPDTRAGRLPSATTRPRFFTGFGASYHDLAMAWNCCDDPPADPNIVTVPGRKEPAPPPLPAPGLDGEAADLIVAVPPWTDGRYDEPKTQALRAAAARARSVSSFQLRAAIRAFEDAHRNAPDSTRQLSRIYLLLRAIFNVPDWMARTDAGVFGGWNHPSVGKPGQPAFRIAWPLAVDDAGRLVVEGEFTGYRGMPYDATAEFDFLAARFDRR